MKKDHSVCQMLKQPPETGSTTPGVCVSLMKQHPHPGDAKGGAAEPCTLLKICHYEGKSGKTWNYNRDKTGRNFAVGIKRNVCKRFNRSFCKISPCALLQLLGVKKSSSSSQTGAPPSPRHPARGDDHGAFWHMDGSRHCISFTISTLNNLETQQTEFGSLPEQWTWRKFTERKLWPKAITNELKGIPIYSRIIE